MSTPVASAALSQDKLLAFMPTDVDKEWVSEIESAYPGFKIHWIDRRHPDGSMKKYEELPSEVWDGLTMLLTHSPPPAELLSKVRFVQLTSAGADAWAGHDTYKKDEVMFCTTNGIHPPQIAEWVIGAWLSHQHHFPRYYEQMKRGFWEPPVSSQVEDSTGARMGILGYGAIGRQCARVARSLGMEVLAYTRTEKPTPESRRDDSYCVPGTGDPEGLIPTRWFHGASRDAVDDFLAQDLDILVVSLPLTESTRGILSYRQFELLSKRRTFVCNIARGGHIDQEALLQALERGQIRGAAIDVTDPEPLDSQNPLWKAPNLLITPHVSWLSTHYWKRTLDIMRVNLGHLSSGRPLINVVDRQHHY